MVLSDVFDRFVAKTPLAVMARSLLERILDPDTVNRLFHKNANAQYTRELTFSSVVDLMGRVVTSAFPSVRAAHIDKSSGISVSLTSLYNKLQGIEPVVSRSLVQHVASQLQPLIQSSGGALPEMIPGYEMYILDGNALAGTEHRLPETRDSSAAPLPGKSLCLYRPAYQLITDVIPCEDGHTQERSLVAPILEGLQKNHLLVADRNFCFQSFLVGIINKLAYFVIRQHSGLNINVDSELRHCGWSDTGEVFEQDINIIDECGTVHKLRRIVVRLKQATEDGDCEIAILTNLPESVSALLVSDVYRKRWSIEGGFLDLTTTLGCEIKTLCYPQASLFVFCVAVMAYNMLGAIQGVVRAEHGAEKVEKELSRYYMVDEIGQVYRGMMVAVPVDDWEMIREMSFDEFVEFLRGLARNIDLDRYRKSRRGPKKKKPQRKHDPSRPHVSVAKLLRARKANKATRE